MGEYLSVPTVVKIGGSIGAQRNGILNNIAFLHQEMNVPLVIVHGGGPEIDAALKMQDIKPQKIDGQRVTDSQTLSVVVSVLNGINNQLVEELERQNIKTHSYTAESGLLQGEIRNSRLGFVGSISSVRTYILEEDLKRGYLPVVTPIAILPEENQLLNINGDIAAGAIAASIGANLMLVTDVPGVMDKRGEVIKQMDRGLYKQMLDAGAITSGMIPKLEAAFMAVGSGKMAFVCQASDLLSTFTENPKGTLCI